MPKTYVNALVYDKNNLGIDENVRESLLLFYQRNTYIDSIPDNPLQSIVEGTEDACLHKATDLGYQFLILTWEGNIINITKYHETCIRYINNLHKETNGEWLVVGHIMNQYKNRELHNDPKTEEWRDSFWLYPITAIINLKKWDQLGRPAWGQEDGIKEVACITPSPACVHDNYTPLFIVPGQGKTNAKVKKGWNIINAAIEAGLSCNNLPEEIRQSQNHLYPEVDTKKYNDFWTSVFNFPKMTDQYKRIFENVMFSKYPRRIYDKSWQCFIKNTEEYKPRVRDYSNLNWDGIDTVLMPCSGFKDFIITYGSTGPRRPMNFIHYDIIRGCTYIREQIIDAWDGTRTGLITTLTNIANDYKMKFDKDVFHMHAMKSYEEVYDHILQYFNNEQDLEIQWKEFQKCKHVYKEVDLLEDPLAAIKLIEGKHVYLCMSDIAGWRNNLIAYGYRNLRNDIMKCLKMLRNKNITGFVDYKDPGTDLQLWQDIDGAIEFLQTPRSDAWTFLNERYLPARDILPQNQ